MKYKNIKLLFFLLTSTFYGWGQKTTFQVVTKTIEETNNWNEKQTLEINGENAIIHISTWDQPRIKTTIELIAKHPEKAIAEKDVEVLQYSISSQKRRISISNYLAISKSTTKPSSTLKTKMTLIIPKNCPLSVQNNFGSIHIEGLKQRLKIDSRFTNISIKKLKGELKINSHLGEISGKDIIANTTITSNRSKVYFEQLSGNIDINAKYGTIQIAEDPAYSYQLNIKGNKSNVTILNAQPTLNAYDLTTSFGSITTHQQNSFDVILDSDTLKQIHAIPSSATSNISIALDYGDIILN